MVAVVRVNVLSLAFGACGGCVVAEGEFAVCLVGRERFGHTVLSGWCRSALFALLIVCFSADRVTSRVKLSHAEDQALFARQGAGFVGVAKSLPCLV